MHFGHAQQGSTLTIQRPVDWFDYALDPIRRYSRSPLTRGAVSCGRSHESVLDVPVSDRFLTSMHEPPADSTVSVDFAGWPRSFIRNM